MKQKYFFYCMNADIDCHFFFFDNDSEAIEFAVNYEADCFRVIDEHSMELIYCPEWCFENIWKSAS